MDLRSLVIALDLPVPVSGGGDLRTRSVIEALGRLGPVGVFGVRPRRGEPSPVPGLTAWRSSTDRRLLDPRAQAEASLGWLGRADGHPGDRWWSDLAAAELTRLAGELEPDLIVVEGLWVAGYGEAIRGPGRHLVLDAHNAESALLGDLLDSRGGHLPVAVATRIGARVGRREAAAVAAADQTWAPSRRDAAALAAAHPAGSDRIHVVPNGIPVDAYRGPPAGRRGRVMIYPASFAYPPNREAARRLVGGLLPVVRGAVADARLLLVGRDLPEELGRAAGVEAPGWVPDMLPYLHRASVMPVALREGAGTRLKVIEAFAAGVAVVSTAKGVEGLDVRDGEHVVLAESDADLAAGVLRLWADDRLRARLTASGLAFARERHGPDAVAAAIGRALRGRGGVPPAGVADARALRPR
jgi:glycosyltransferase involved in cell wall biosynthesis